jgi:hypothetical protein
LPEGPSSSLIPPKFIRRQDLTRDIRSALVIQAYQAQQEGTWGVITQLSRQYEVSRTFIYSLLSYFKRALGHLVFPESELNALSMEAIEARILAQRFEGRSSIDAISTLMKRENLPYSSTGSISQILSRIGGSLPNVLTNKAEPQVLVFAEDEIFARSSPILITVDPVSSAILSIELADQRTSEQWEKHLKGIVENGFSPRLVTSDAGTAIKAAHGKVFTNIPWQLDTFHGVSHRLGHWDERLEKSAYAAIEAVAKREKTLASARSDVVVDKRLNRCFEADKKEQEVIELYDNFHYLYQFLIHQLKTFDSAGKLRQRDQVEENMAIAFELMTSLPHKTICKEAALIKKTLPDLLTYFDDAVIAFEKCQQLTTNKDALQSLVLAWQWNKNVIKSKVTTRKNHAIEQRDFYLQLASLFVGDDEQALKLKEGIYAELDQIIQASSMVECINSILRPYLNNSKNQVTQEFLNTFMFYHNHRRYHAGKRHGKTPMELLTGKAQEEDWIVLLQKEIKEKRLTA